MKKEVKKNNKGFSLVELIVVVAIMAVLMVVLAPAMLRYVEKTRKQKDDSAADEVRSALQNALADNDVYEKVNTAVGTLSADTTDVIVVTIDSAGAISITTPAAGIAELLTEITDTVGSSITISSKTRAAGYKIGVDYSASRKTYVVKKAEPQ